MGTIQRLVWYGMDSYCDVSRYTDTRRAGEGEREREGEGEGRGARERSKAHQNRDPLFHFETRDP